MIEIGTKVHVSGVASGSDQRYAGRDGIVVAFDPLLKWRSPRALLAPDQFVCVHFLPKSRRERRDGSPLDLIAYNNLIVDK